MKSTKNINLPELHIAGALIFRFTKDFFSNNGLAAGDSIANCSAQDNFFWTTCGLVEDLNEDCVDELHEGESFRRTFVGLTQAA